MNIIKDNTIKQYTCNKCKSILEISKKDLYEEYGDFLGYIHTADYFICPCCGETNYVN